MLESELPLPKTDLSKIELVYHPTTDQELRDKLWPLKLSYGDFQNVLRESWIYDTLQVVAATGPLGGIHGWAGIYKRGDMYYIGVFVEELYRNQGLGGKLKNKALEICKDRGLTCRWQDRKDNDKWVEVSPEGTEKRFPYE